MDMRINTCYVVKIQSQLDAEPDKKTGSLAVSGKHQVDDRLMRQTADVCLEALKFCVSVIQDEWGTIMAAESKTRKRLVDVLIHISRIMKTGNRHCRLSVVQSQHWGSHHGMN